MTFKHLFIIAIFACILSCPGVGAQDAAVPATEQTGAETSTAQKEASTTQTELKETDMIATVNGTTITLGEMHQEAQRLRDQLSQTMPPDQMTQLASNIEKQALENVVNRTLLMQTADKKSIAADPATIQTRYDEIVAQFPSKEAFETQLGKWGVTEEQIKKDLTSELKISELLEQQLKDVPAVNDDEIKSFYEANPEYFKKNERIKASHILISSDASEDESVKAEKRKKLEGLKSELEKGADFTELAKANSDCPSKENGGDLGFFERGQMVKPFEDAAFNLKEGQISDIVETQFGYHLIKVTGHEEAGTVPLEEVKPQVQNYLKQERDNEALGKYVESLQKEATITYAPGYEKE